MSADSQAYTAYCGPLDLAVLPAMSRVLETAGVDPNAKLEVQVDSDGGIAFAEYRPDIEPTNGWKRVYP